MAIVAGNQATAADIYTVAGFGDGSDGALSISSGTTTLSAASAATLVKNYTSLSITSTGKLAFSNPNTNGTTIILKVQGNVTITSSATCIDASGMGAAAGNAGYGFAIVKTNFGPSASDFNAPTASALPTLDTVDQLKSFYSNKYGIVVPGAGGGGANKAGGSGGASYITAGDSGGAGANTGGLGTPGNGARGGGVLIIECGGSLNFTTASGISVAGAAGTAGSGGTNTGGGGGGGGGICLIFYKSLTAASGTIVVSGGAGGAQVGTGGGGGAGGAGYSLVAAHPNII